MEGNWMTSYVSAALANLRFAKDYAVGVGAYLLASKGHKSMPSLTPLESITQLSPLVVRILGQNPGPFTLQGTNTYIVGSGERRILIDAGEPNIAKYTEELKAALKGSVIDAIIITHWHHDHVGGIPNVIKEVIGNEVPIYKIKREGGPEDPSQFTYITDGHEIKVDGATLKFVHTPGHTKDHSALWLEEEQIVFSGDCILGEGTTVFEDLHDFINSLKKIRGLDAKRIYPGHGPVVENANEKVDEYISHRQKREEEIMSVITTQKEVTSMDITNIVYKDSPTAVRIAALNNVKLVLNKLIKDGKVEKTGFEMYKLKELSIVRGVKSHI